MSNSVKLPLKKDITLDSFQVSPIVFNRNKLDSVAAFYDISHEAEKSLKNFQDKLDHLSEQFKNNQIDMSQYVKELESINNDSSKTDIKISMNRSGKFIVSVEAELKLEYQTDKQIAASVKAGKFVEKKVNQKQYLYVVVWEESERGWDVRPDGCSAHLSEKAAMDFIKKQQDSLPKGYVPDEYSRPSGKPHLVEVSKSLYDYVVSKGEAKADTWLNVNNPKDLVNFDASSLGKKIPSI